MKRTRTRPTVHARYLSWAGKARSVANREARLRGEGDVLTPFGFHLHLYLWGVQVGRIKPPDEPDRLHSCHVAEMFAADPEAVKNEARRYWRQQIRART